MCYCSSQRSWYITLLASFLLDFGFCTLFHSLLSNPSTASICMSVDIVRERFYDMLSSREWCNGYHVTPDALLVHPSLMTL